MAVASILRQISCNDKKIKEICALHCGCKAISVCTLHLYVLWMWMLLPRTTDKLCFYEAQIYD